MNGPLARALRSAGLDATGAAARLGVDPKTVQRWMAGRMPYPRHRDALVRLTRWAPHDLWPNLPHPAEPARADDEVRIVYPHRSSVPTDAWTRLLGSAEQEIGVLAYSALFLAEDASVPHILREKAQAGVRVRIALGDPESEHVARRGDEEGIGDGMSARIRTALVGFQPLTEEPNFRIRLHDTVLYNSIYWADHELLVNTHIYGRPGAHAPVLHLRQVRLDGMVTTYLASFERVWSAARDAASGAYQGHEVPARGA
ncbi:XRE family transcriptional regulator [Asanoa sp. WMMD1127]|uniref:XRE family transcriptional regulator n=1 Tax=Asanoa sp. WMMD1127 TaxID=3016107 RepID=UPI0024173289|nr:XRE family transcriptional regulator [Asanoa sp. WMMD1127]MDG4821908.1 XRE family transcriptional regulator [Asanoa sp. WMMD1127]